MEDEGRGIPAELLLGPRPGVVAVGVGVAGIRERVKQLDGTLVIDSHAGGTTIVVRFSMASVERRAGAGDRKATSRDSWPDSEDDRLQSR